MRRAKPAASALRRRLRLLSLLVLRAITRAGDPGTTRQASTASVMQGA